MYKPVCMETEIEESDAGDCWYKAPHPPIESCKKEEIILSNFQTKIRVLNVVKFSYLWATSWKIWIKIPHSLNSKCCKLFPIPLSSLLLSNLSQSRQTSWNRIRLFFPTLHSHIAPCSHGWQTRIGMAEIIKSKYWLDVCT